MTKDLIIKRLKLQPHPHEGGYFSRTYTSKYSLTTRLGERKIFSSIYYLLCDEQPIGYLHRNRSDILHYFHSGYPLRYLLLFPDGSWEEHWLGNDLLAGQVPQLLVPGGVWKATILEDGDFALISEAVSPGFDYIDNELADQQTLSQHSAAVQRQFLPFIKP